MLVFPRTTGVTGTIRGGDSICELGKRDRSLRSLKAYRKKSCYILQDDRLNPLFTVSELMRFATDMKLGNTLNEKLKLSVVSRNIHTLYITQASRKGNRRHLRHSSETPTLHTLKLLSPPRSPSDRSPSQM
jgi:hypothetical protein